MTINFPPPPPPLPSSGIPVIRLSRTVLPVITFQQGGGYKLCSSLSILLRQSAAAEYYLLFDGPINPDALTPLLYRWRHIYVHVTRGNTIDADGLDEEKMIEVITILRKIRSEWPGYIRAKKEVKHVFRGDSRNAAISYTWLQHFLRVVQQNSERVQNQLCRFDITLYQIFSTTVNPQLSYVSHAPILWDLQLKEDHPGISMPLYFGEDEVTFPIGTKIQISKLIYLPPGNSYQNNRAIFGADHRYVISGTING